MTRKKEKIRRPRIFPRPRLIRSLIRSLKSAGVDYSTWGTGVLGSTWDLLRVLKNERSQLWIRFDEKPVLTIKTIVVRFRREGVGGLESLFRVGQYFPLSGTIRKCDGEGMQRAILLGEDIGSAAKRVAKEFLDSNSEHQGAVKLRDATTNENTINEMVWQPLITLLEGSVYIATITGFGPANPRIIRWIDNQIDCIETYEWRKRKPC